MRIICGTAGGRRLKGPPNDSIRPVLDQVKESIFNILFDVTGMSVLDVFAGTGSLGLEAVSRGASCAVFIENNSKAIRIIRENIKICGFKDACRLIPKHVNVALKLLHREERKFQLIFIDPPYLKNLVNPTIQLINEHDLLQKGGLIITEHHPKEPLKDLPGDLSISDERKYGQTYVTFVTKGA